MNDAYCYPLSATEVAQGVTIDARYTTAFSFVEVTLKDGTRIFVDLKTNEIKIKKVEK